MNLSLAMRSLILFVGSVLLLVLLTAFESAFIGMPGAVERFISVLLLILPGVAGIVFGLLSLYYNEMKTGMAIASITLNLLLATFQVLVLSFAG